MEALVTPFRGALVLQSAPLSFVLARRRVGLCALPGVWSPAGMTLVFAGLHVSGFGFGLDARRVGLRVARLVQHVAVSFDSLHGPPSVGLSAPS